MYLPEVEIFYRLFLLASQKEVIFVKIPLTLTTRTLDRPGVTFDVDRVFSVLHLMDFLQINSQGLDFLYCRSIIWGTQQPGDMSFILLQTCISAEMNGVIFLDFFFFLTVEKWILKVEDCQYIIDQKALQHSSFFKIYFKLLTEGMFWFAKCNTEQLFCTNYESLI